MIRKSLPFCLYLALSGLCISAQSASILPTKILGKAVLDSSPLSIEIGDHKGLVAVFLSTVCPCSNSHLGELRKLTEEFPDFVFVGIHSNVDEGKDQTVAYFKNANLPFKIVQDTGARIADEFKALKTPHAFVILKDGTLSYQGGVSDSHDFAGASRKYLREALSDLAAGRKPKTPEGRTLGCAISRGEKNVW